MSFTQMRFGQSLAFCAGALGDLIADLCRKLGIYGFHTGIQQFWDPKVKFESHNVPISWYGRKLYE